MRSRAASVGTHGSGEPVPIPYQAGLASAGKAAAPGEYVMTLQERGQDFSHVVKVDAKKSVLALLKCSN